MRDKLKHLEKIIDKNPELALKNRFPYIFTKAYSFVEKGAKTYRLGDALNMPDDSYTEEDIENLKNGCKQLINGIGFSIDSPLEGLSIRGCHKLFNIFHFEMTNQMLCKNKEGNFVDKITFRHVVDKKEVTYYNKVIT